MSLCFHVNPAAQRCSRSQAVPCTVPSAPGSTGMGTAGGTGVTAQSEA